MADSEQASVAIPRPVLVGAMSGVFLSLVITTADILPPNQGHAILISAVATPYIAFALVDSSPRSALTEFSVAIAFVTASFVVLNANVWIVATVLAAHGLWDLAHIRFPLNPHCGNYPKWCGVLDIAAAATLLITSA